MGKLLVLALLCGGTAVFFVPVEGKTMWRRAVERGIPTACARATARGLRAGWDFVASLSHKDKDDETGRKSPARARRLEPRPVPPRAPRDGILPQPPKEDLRESDRKSLDRLIAGSR